MSSNLSCTGVFNYGMGRFGGAGEKEEEVSFVLRPIFLFLSFVLLLTKMFACPIATPQPATLTPSHHAQRVEVAIGPLGVYW